MPPQSISPMKVWMSLVSVYTRFPLFLQAKSYPLRSHPSDLRLFHLGCQTQHYRCHLEHHPILVHQPHQRCLWLCWLCQQHQRPPHRRHRLWFPLLRTKCYVPRIFWEYGCKVLGRAYRSEGFVGLEVELGRNLSGTICSGCDQEYPADHHNPHDELGYRIHHFT